MTCRKRALGIALLGGWALMFFSTVAWAQVDLNSVFSSNKTSRSSWEQRVIQRDRSQVRTASQDQPSYRVAQGNAARPGGISPMPGGVPAPAPTLMLPPEAPTDKVEVLPKGQLAPKGGEIAPVPMEEGMLAATGGCASCGGGGAGCDSCEDCDDGEAMGWPTCVGIPGAWIHHFGIFAGVQGFKGPTDQGRNGNFGFHEGVNLGGPLGDPWGFGYQAGLQGVHSDFKGTQTLAVDQQADGGSRNQIFVTGGVFRRAQCGGFQGGTVIDYFHDSYFENFDLMQVRTEASLVAPDWFEVGFWGAFSVSKDQITTHLRSPFTFLTAKDMYSVFFRRYFSGGGQGRLWLGVSGQNEVAFGGDIMVPLGTSWSLENNFTYLAPKRGVTTGGQIDESWSVAMQLVWYPGRSSRCVRENPYYPLFSVADNSVFLVDHR